MAVTYTSKLNLAKPDENEVVDIAVINSNMDKIDALGGNTNTLIKQSTNPGTPSNINALWINTSTHVIYYWTGAIWQPIRGVAGP